MRTRTFLIIFVLIALAGIVAWYFLYAGILASATTEENATAARQNEATASQQDQSLAVFLSTSSSTATSLLASVVPAEGSVPFIGMIESLGASAAVGLKVEGVSIASASTLAPNASTADFDALTLSLSIQGSWNAVHTFLTMLQTLPYKVEVNGISLSQSVFSAPAANGKVGKPQSFWSGSLSLSVLKQLAPEDTP